MFSFLRVRTKVLFKVEDSESIRSQTPGAKCDGLEPTGVRLEYFVIVLYIHYTAGVIDMRVMK